MTDCEMPGDPLPEEFTRIGPLQKVVAVKVLAHGERLMRSIEKSDCADFEELKTLRSEAWETFKKETTSAEVSTIELLWDIHECQAEVSQGKTEKLQTLAKDLSKRIPFDGIDANDVTWEILHSSLLLAKVVPAYVLIAGMSFPLGSRLDMY